MFAIQTDLFQIQAEPVKKKQLRDYQKSAIQGVLKAILEGHTNICLVLPTGAGKTVTVAHLMLELKQQLSYYNPLALVPRRKLQKQMKREFSLCGIDSRVVRTAQSVTDKKTELGVFSNISVLILDECHELAWWEPCTKVQAINPGIITIGLTATPDRSSKKEFFEDKFSKIIYPVSFGDLVSAEHLCNPRYFAYGNEIEFQEVGIGEDGGFIQEQLDRQCEKKHFNETVVKNLVKHEVGKRRSICFCSSVKQSKQLAEMLSNAGISAIHVDGSMSDKAQDEAIAKVATGEISALCCAKLLIAGFDEPRIDTVVLATATNSRTSLVQMCGRGSRLHPDKLDEFWVFDFGDNFARLQIGLKQPFPYKSRDDIEENQAPTKVCPECGTINLNFVRVCKNADCGYIFPVKPKRIQDLQDLDIVEVEADLQDLYHIKQIRKQVREAYQADELPFVKIENYCRSKQISPKHLINAATLKGAIFKNKSLENVLNYTFYVDHHIHRLQQRKYNKSELKHFNSLNLLPKEVQKVAELWVTTLANFPAIEFGDYLRSRAVTKHLYNGKWFDVLGVMPISSREDMEAAYKRRWRAINAELEWLTNLKDGEINPDATIEILSHGNSGEIKDLRNQILVLEWAWQYVNLIYPIP